MNRRFTIWQCTDFCCENKPFSEKWWNVGTSPGKYDTLGSWRQAIRYTQTWGFR